MKILIVGGFGYLGGRIAAHLASDRHHLIITGRKLTPTRAAWLESLKAQYLHLDVLHSMPVLEKSDVDIIVYLAALPRRICEANPRLALHVNSWGVHRVLEWALDYGCRGVVYLSTFQAYGTDRASEIFDDSPCAPINHYALTHLFAEEYVLHWGRVYKRGAVVLRVANGAGAPAFYEDGEHWKLLFLDLCLQAHRRKQLWLRSNRRERRDFVTVQSIVDAIKLCVIAPSVGQKRMNLGYGRTMTVGEMAMRIGSVAANFYGLPNAMPVRFGEQPATMSGDFQIHSEGLRNMGWLPCDNWNEEICATLRHLQALGSHSGV